MSESRRQYRIRPEGAEKISVSLVLASGSVVPGRLVDASAGGVGVHVEAKSETAYRLGEQLSLQLSADQLPEPISAKVVVTRREDHDDGRSYGLELTDPDEFRSHLPAELVSVFNQRRVYRVEADPSHPIPVTVEGVDLPFELKAWLRDFSSEGISFRTALLAECALSKTDLVQTTFQLPQSKPLTFGAKIQHRFINGDAICYGVTFLRSHTSDLLEKQAHIRQWVQDQQRKAVEELSTQS